jgi:hypothetical protein
MLDIYTQFAPFITVWRSLRPDVSLRIALLRAGAQLPGKADELARFMKAVDSIVEGLRRGTVAPMTEVYRSCHIVSACRVRDELIDRIRQLSTTYRHTLFVTRPLPAP